MFEQYWLVRDTLPEHTLLFYRMGDFYELFGKDAVVAAPILEVQLTARNKDAELPVPMCGVPAHAMDSYAEKLLAAGRKVALCEQLSEPGVGKAKLVERGIVRILTPGLPVDPSRMQGRAPHFMGSLGFNSDNSLLFLAYDFLAHELFSGTLEDFGALKDLLLRVDPKELLVPSDFSSKKNEISEPWASRLTPWSGRDAHSNLEEYLVYTQRCKREDLKGLLPEAKSLNLISGQGSSSYAQLPASVLEQWAVLPNLVNLLDCCGSAVGARRLRNILSLPLTSPDRILQRQNLAKKLHSASEIRKAASEVYDLERILGRFRVGAAAPRELVQLSFSLEAASRALALAPCDTAEYLDFARAEGLPELEHLRAKLLPLQSKLMRALNASVDLNRNVDLSAIVALGFDPELDVLKALNSDSEKWLQDFELRLRTETGISSLKVRYNRVFGYFIEVTKTHLSKVPASFDRKQTTVSGERFTCTELKNKEHEILSAGHKAEARAKEILESLGGEVLSFEEDLQHFLPHVSWMDALSSVQLSVAKLQRHGVWTFPEVLGGDFSFVIREARHPVMEALLGSFVPNSIELGVGQARLLVLTGPNMAGKSTLMRQTGLCLLLAQCGLAVPASFMSFSPARGFYSRMGASDKILEGESTFMVEMKETAAILKDADRNSFVLIDEIGRGTSTQDGLAIARAVLEHVHNVTGSIGIFATHYHELSDAVGELPYARNASMAIREWKGELVFLRSLRPEPAESSYGIYVAKMAGLPQSLLKRAQNLFARGSATSQGASSGARSPEEAGQLDIFNSQDKAHDTSQVESLAQSLAPTFVESLAGAASSNEALIGELQKLKSLKLDELSPKQAWLALEGLLAILDCESQKGPEKADERKPNG